MDAFAYRGKELLNGCWFCGYSAYLTVLIYLQVHTLKKHLRCLWVVWHLIRPKVPTIACQLLHLCYKVGLLAWCNVCRVLYQQKKYFVSPEVMVLVGTLRAGKANPHPAYVFILVRVNPCPFSFLFLFCCCCFKDPVIIRAPWWLRW